MSSTVSLHSSEKTKERTQKKKEDEYSFSGPQTHLNPMMDANDPVITVPKMVIIRILLWLFIYRQS